MQTALNRPDQITIAQDSYIQIPRDLSIFQSLGLNHRQIILYFLLSDKVKMYAQKGAGFKFRVNHSDMAAYLGVSPDTFRTDISSLKKVNLIAQDPDGSYWLGDFTVPLSMGLFAPLTGPTHFTYLYFSFQKSLLSLPISFTDRLVFMHLFDRHKASVRSQKYHKSGKAFVFYSQEDLCKVMKISRNTLSKSIHSLETAHLITLERLTRGYRIFVNDEFIIEKAETLPVKSAQQRQKKSRNLTDKLSTQPENLIITISDNPENLRPSKNLLKTNTTGGDIFINSQVKPALQGRQTMDDNPRQLEPFMLNGQTFIVPDEWDNQSDHQDYINEPEYRAVLADIEYFRTYESIVSKDDTTEVIEQKTALMDDLVAVIRNDRFGNYVRSTLIDEISPEIFEQIFDKAYKYLSAGKVYAYEPFLHAVVKDKLRAAYDLTYSKASFSAQMAV